MVKKKALINILPAYKTPKSTEFKTFNAASSTIQSEFQPKIERRGI